MSNSVASGNLIASPSPRVFRRGPFFPKVESLSLSRVCIMSTEKLKWLHFVVDCGFRFISSLPI